MFSRRQVAALAVLTLPVLLVTLDMTVLGVALPALTADLAPSASAQLWIVDVYSFVLAGLLLVMGSLGDRIGRRRLLLIGTAAFGLASVLAAFAPSAGTLIAARALLGLGGATLMPSTLSLIRTVFPGARARARAVGVWAATFSAGAAAGPLLGGWLLEHFWWGSVFLVNAPVCAALLVAGPLLLPESRDPHPGRFDLPSAVLALAAVLPVVAAVKSTATAGPSPTALAGVAVGLVAGTAFVRRQRRVADPLLDPALFTRRFTGAVTTNLLSVFALVGMLVLLPQHLQLVEGMSPLQAAAWLVPGMLAGVAAALGAARLVTRVAVRRLVPAGLAVATVGVGSLALLGAGAGPVLVLVAFTATGASIALVEALTTEVVLSAAPADRAGAASAVSETGYELGGALGTAVLGSVAAAAYRAGLPAGTPGDTVSATLAAVGTGPQADAARAAFASAVSGAAGLGALVLAAAAVLAWLLLRPAGSRPRRSTEPGAAAPRRPGTRPSERAEPFSAAR